ncbi:MAG: dac [Acidimicrobiales bacterium]|nr:dac [Acidimicrobiales bacterium]
MRRTVLPVLLLTTALVLAGLGWRTGTSDAAASGSTTRAATTPILSARRIPVWLAAPVADAKLRQALDGVVAASPSATCLVVSARGRVIFEHNPNQPLSPASTEKLVTASVALDLLTPTFRYQTRVVGAKPAADGTVSGDVWLVGGGDPMLATKAYSDHFTIHSKIHTPLETLADNIKQAGVRHITGRLLGDESRYDTERYVPSWPARYIQQNQSGPLSALTVNDGFTAWPPREGPGAAEETPAADPPANAATVLAGLLRDRGIAVDGGPGTGKAPAGAAALATIASPPMPQILDGLLTGSDNQTAESLVKELGLVKGGAGTTPAGMQVLNGAVARLGLGRPGSASTDGSGLDEANRVTCRQLTALLDRTGRNGLIGQALPVAGVSGTLTDRFTAPPVKGHLRAKTGTLNAVSALSGFADAQGTALTFAYIATGRTVNPALLRIQDDLAAALVRYPEGPPPADLGPR